MAAISMIPPCLNLSELPIMGSDGDNRSKQLTILDLIDGLTSEYSLKFRSIEDKRRRDGSDTTCNPLWRFRLKAVAGVALNVPETTPAPDR